MAICCIPLTRSPALVPLYDFQNGIRSGCFVRQTLLVPIFAVHYLIIKNYVQAVTKKNLWPNHSEWHRLPQLEMSLGQIEA